MLRQSQKPKAFSVEEFNLQAPDRRALYRMLNTQGMINQYKARRVRKVLDGLLIALCVVAAVYVAQDITRQAYERIYHEPLTFASAAEYLRNLLNLP